MTSAPPPPARFERFRAAGHRFFARLREFIDGFGNQQNAKQDAKPQPSPFAQRPPGWRGYWSERYGEMLGHTLNLAPPFPLSQSELVAAIPRPLQEALEPAASAAEPADRDGNPAPWRVGRSVLIDLFGPVGLVFGAFALAVVAFRLVSALYGLPSLTADPEKQRQQQQQQRPLEQKQAPAPQPQQQQQQQVPAPSPQRQQVPEPTPQRQPSPLNNLPKLTPRS